MKNRHCAQRLAAALLLAAAFLVLGACANSSGAKNKTEYGATIVRIRPDYRTAESFDRISEYFTGAENTGGEIVLRTHPETRAGFYFFTRLKVRDDITIADAQIEIGVITPASPEAKTFLLRVPVALRKGTVLLNPGLTGPDWPWTGADANARPVAWRVRLLHASGAVLASAQSYLWSKSP